jgi:hypothetical protein
VGFQHWSGDGYRRANAGRLETRRRRSCGKTGNIVLSGLLHRVYLVRVACLRRGLIPEVQEAAMIKYSRQLTRRAKPQEVY